MTGKYESRIGVIGLVLGLFLAAAPSMVGAQAWHDNENEIKSNDPKYNFRRSEHFRINWAKGVADNADANGGYKDVTEQLVQGNLQMLEQVWHRYHDPESAGGMGFHPTGRSTNPDRRNDTNLYRANLTMSCTGNYASGAWGSVDSAGLPNFALPPSYLGFDPPSGATPHEYSHTSEICAEGFNDTPYDGMWHEATANWFMLQYNNAYPNPGGAIQPYMSLPHGRNYYDAWLLYEYMREQPGYGYAFVNKLWTQANGNKSKGGEYIYDAMARLDTNHGPDSYNAIKDAIGGMASHTVTWDYERGQFFRKSVSRSTDPYSEMYRRGYTELDRRNGDTTWFRVPFAHAPMNAGYNVVQIALNGKKKGADYTVNVNFRPVWDSIRRSDMRATLVAVNDNGEPRYSEMWNGGVNSITLASDENQLFLVVAATPDFMGAEGFRHPLISDLPWQPQAYEVSFPKTQATAFESKMARPEGVTGKAHSNGGGFVADTAKVDATAYVGPNAMVLGNAQVLGKASVSDFAVVMGNAVVKDNARVSGHALVKDNAQIYGNGKARDWATVAGNWKVYDNGRALERCWLMDKGEISGNATIKGNVPDYGGAKVSGHAIKEGDCANGVSVDHQVLMCWVWGFDQAYADRQPDTGGLYANYTFESTDPIVDPSKVEPDGGSPYGTDASGKGIIYPRSNSIYAHDTYGVVHGYLMGSPKTVVVNDKALNTVLALNGKNQYIELKKDVSDFNNTTYAMWVNWAGGAANQRIFNFGDGAYKYAYLTPRNSEGKLEFAIADGSKTRGRRLFADPLPTNTWTHVAVSFKNHQVEVYVNGKVVAADQSELNPDDVLAPNCLDGNNFTFIGRGDKGNYFNGMIDDFRAYVEPQTAQDIAKLAAAVTNRTAKVVPAAKDADPFAPGFLVVPVAVSESSVQMSATRPASKTAWFEYYFKCTRGGGHDSGWISSNRYTDCMLKPGSYSYVVMTRNRDGKVSAQSAPASAVVAKASAAPVAEFATAPVGISDSAIKMVAKKSDVPGLVEYKFTRNDGVTSGWQASHTWIDKGLTAGGSYSYMVQSRKGTIVSVPSTAKTAIARDDTAPARYVVGEWQTLPYATVDNTISLKAMPVYSPRDRMSIEKEPVEYYFKCVKGDGPDSGWITDNKWVTPVLGDGTYTYQFKIRDTSPQHNETPFSGAQSTTITKLTGYHKYSIKQVNQQPEGALVSFVGKVTSVEKDHYVVSADGATCKVVPATKGDQTDASFNGKEVSVKGGLWKVGDEMRVTWAEVK